MGKLWFGDQNTKHRMQDVEFFSRVPSDVSDFDIMRIGHEQWNPHFHAIRSHFGSYQVLVYVIGGKGVFKANAIHSQLRSGMVFGFGYRSNHEFWCNPSDPLEVYIVSFYGKKVPTLMFEYFGGTTFVVNPANPDTIVHTIENCFWTAKNKEPYGYEMCKQYLQLFLLTIRSGMLISETSTSTKEATFFRCKKYIDTHFMDLPSTTPIARACNISQEYLCRLFKYYAHTTPYHYLLRLKINYAIHLLYTSDVSIKELARILGFSDQYIFSAAFKRVTGLAPSLY